MNTVIVYKWCINYTVLNSQNCAPSNHFIYLCISMLCARYKHSVLWLLWLNVSHHPVRHILLFWGFSTNTRGSEASVLNNKSSFSFSLLRAQHGVQSFGPPARQHHLSQQVSNRRWETPCLLTHKMSGTVSSSAWMLEGNVN